LLALAVALRIAAFSPYSSHHPDETIQYLEQAHRIVFGYGVVPWEFRYFIRSWLIPLMLVPPMQLGEWLDPGGTLYLVLPRAMFAALNIAPVVAAWFIGRRMSRQHGIVAMAVMAVWVECVLFSVHTLSESLAISCFLTAVVLLHARARMPAIVAAGMLMGLAGLMRFQFGPAIAVYALIVAGRDWRLWKGLLLGGIPVVIGGGLLDLAMGLYPYEWILTNYRMNIVENRMLRIGGVSHWTYAQSIIAYWQAGILVIPFLAALAWKQNRALLVAAGVNLLVHQIIGHKEYRYIWFSMEIILLVAAMGSVELLRSTIGGRRIGSILGVAGLVGLWSAASLALAMTHTYRFEWRKSGASSRLAARAMRDPAVCGLAVPRRQYTQFGYAFLHRDKPVFLLSAVGQPGLAHPEGPSAGFNAILSWAENPQPSGFPQRIACSGRPGERICLYRRPGSCTLDARSESYLYQQTLNRLDM
jgi:hypothetical protein